MRRTAILAAGAGVLIGLSWLRLEEPRGGGGRLPLVLAFAIAPALLPRARWRLLAAIPALLLGAAAAFDVSPLAAPHSFLGRVLDGADAGLRAFYDVPLPFDPARRPAMHGLVLLAACAFSLAVALAIRDRRPITASLLLAFGAAWPATLRPGDGDLGRGALILAASLILLAALRPRALPARGPALVAGAGVVLAALLVASYPAVARDQVFDDWRTWSPYSQREPGVGVDYVWNSSYAGIDFPDDPTGLLEIAAPQNPLYWRATTLDIYRRGHWLESLGLTAPVERAGRVELTRDADLPQRAKETSRWFEQQVRVTGLRDTHLVGASTPIAYEVDDDERVEYSAGGVAEIDGGLRRDFRYTVWSYSSTPNPRRLAEAPARYEPELAGTSYLEVERDVYVPPFGTPGRHAAILELLRTEPGLDAYEPLYRLARRVGGEATPYGAVVAVETWLRTSPRFFYEEQPPRTLPGVPPLVDFLTRTRQGYCQHYAGAMALMLRYLGIPARVAAGFTSGSYDSEDGIWTVTDRNAHTWVEVWFRGYGWLPFDPTPGRGRLAGPYTSASLGFRGREALAALGAATLLGADGRRAIRDQIDRQRVRERAIEGRALHQARDSEDGRGDETLAVLLLAALGGSAAIAATKIVRRRLRYLGGGSRRAAAACRLELADFVRDQRVDVGPGATLADLGRTVRAALSVDASSFVAAASAARFGPEPAADHAARIARRELRALKRQLRRRLSARRRLRGLVSLRSLRPLR